MWPTIFTRGYFYVITLLDLMLDTIKVFSSIYGFGYYEEFPNGRRLLRDWILFKTLSETEWYTVCSIQNLSKLVAQSSSISVNILA